ncbi:hypothetical protein BAY59_11410 [Prauserella coralliicola]|nr:hypothetical protein BAY59_11410 [Prauserella coralliicola]
MGSTSKNHSSTSASRPPSERTERCAASNSPTFVFAIGSPSRPTTSARNFNPLCAMAGRTTIAEVEQLVDEGELDPDEIHLPGVFVDRVVPLTPEDAVDKKIERLTVREGAGQV